MYTLFIGLPLCLFCMVVGFCLCLTIVGIPAGLAMFALGNKLLYPPRYMSRGSY